MSVESTQWDQQGELAVPVQAIAYPYGEYDEVSEAAVKQAKFLGRCSVKPCLTTATSAPQALPRIEIRGTDSLLDFILKLHWGRGVRSANRNKVA